MTVTTLTSREFNQDASRAKQCTRTGPVFITNRGQPAHVLLSMEDYRRLTGAQITLAQALAQPSVPPGTIDFDFEPPRAGGLYRAADLS